MTNPRNAPEELWAPLNDPAFWAGDPAPHFARLRRAAPVVWNPVFGYWALAAGPIDSFGMSFAGIALSGSRRHTCVWPRSGIPR